MIKICKEIK